MIDTGNFVIWGKQSWCGNTEIYNTYWKNITNSMQLQCIAMCQYIKEKFLWVKTKDEFIIRTLSDSLSQGVNGKYIE